MLLRRRRALSRAASIALLFAPLSTSCGARTPLPLLEESELTCAPGEEQTCLGEDGCSGVQECLPDGSGFTACSCEPEVCFDQVFGATGSPVSLHFIVDRSGSMVVFWEATTGALSSFFGDPASAGLNVALDFFPPLGSDEITQCEIDSYRTPDVDFGELTPETGSADAQEGALLSELARNFPEGGTPMYPAYAGAIEASQQRALSAGGGEIVVVVLVTDGEPTGCESINSKIQVVQLAAEAVGDSPPVRTFAVGLETADQVLVEAVAENGNGESFFIGTEDVAQELVASFERIRKRLSCDYQLSGVPDVLPDDVTVTFTPGSAGASPLPYDPACTQGGWALDKSVSPPVISLCDDACNSIRNDENGELRISAGCADIGPIGSGGTGGTGGSGGAGGSGGGATSDRLGTACSNDSQCGPGLFCMTTGSGAVDGGGPAGGLCTAACTDDSECEAIDALARCEPFQLGGSDRFCVEGCQPGPQGLNVWNSNKCRGRPEVACSPLGDSVVKTSCLPRCNDDTDCGGGLFCHPSDGLCRSTPAPGLPTGSPCNLLADQCRGICVELSSTGGGPTGTCTEWCTDGALPSCGWNGPGTGAADAFCIFGLVPIFIGGGPGQGDLRACAQLCDSDADCLNPELGCTLLNAQFAASTGRLGVCSDPFAGGVSIPPT